MAIPADFEALERRRCEHCGSPFAPVQTHQRFCERSCRDEHHRERRADESALRRWWVVPAEPHVPPGQIEADHYHHDDLGHTFRMRGVLVARFADRWVRAVVEESLARELDASSRFVGLG